MAPGQKGLWELLRQAGPPEHSENEQVFSLWGHRTDRYATRTAQWRDGPPLFPPTHLRPPTVAVGVSAPRASRSSSRGRLIPFTHTLLHRYKSTASPAAGTALLWPQLLRVLRFPRGVTVPRPFLLWWMGGLHQRLPSIGCAPSSQLNTLTMLSAESVGCSAWTLSSVVSRSPFMLSGSFQGPQTNASAGSKKRGHVNRDGSARRGSVLTYSRHTCDPRRSSSPLSCQGGCRRSYKMIYGTAEIPGDPA